MRALASQGLDCIRGFWDKIWFRAVGPQSISIFRLFLFSVAVGLVVSHGSHFQLVKDCHAFKAYGIYRLFEIPCSVLLYQLFFWVSLVSSFMADLGLFNTVS